MAHTLKNLDYSVLQQCMHCGLCLPTCPTYDATKLERNSPRGRIALMRAMSESKSGPVACALISAPDRKSTRLNSSHT